MKDCVAGLNWPRYGQTLNIQIRWASSELHQMGKSTEEKVKQPWRIGVAVVEIHFKSPVVGNKYLTTKDSKLTNCSFTDTRLYLLPAHSARFLASGNPSWTSHFAFICWIRFKMFCSIQLYFTDLNVRLGLRS